MFWPADRRLRASVQLVPLRSPRTKWRNIKILDLRGGGDRCVAVTTVTKCISCLQVYFRFPHNQTTGTIHSDFRQSTFFTSFTICPMLSNVNLPMSVDRSSNVAILNTGPHLISPPGVVENGLSDSRSSDNGNDGLSSLPHDAPRRTLRRKQHTIFHPSSPLIPQLSETSLVNTISSPESFTPPYIPLGHPSRPYYTAIRKNMSRPNSPFDNNSCSSFQSFSATTPPLFRSSPLAYPNDSFDDLPSSSKSLASSRFLTSGFSLSGETEMKLALAGQGTRTTPNQCSQYRYCNMRASGRSRLKDQVRKWSRSFRHLMFRLTVRISA